MIELRRLFSKIDDVITDDYFSWAEDGRCSFFFDFDDADDDVDFAAEDGDLCRHKITPNISIYARLSMRGFDLFHADVTL